MRTTKTRRKYLASYPDKTNLNQKLQKTVATDQLGQYVCNFCQKFYKHPSEISFHIKSHKSKGDEMTHTCSLNSCGSVLNSNPRRRTHSCVKCGTTVYGIWSLRTHFETHYWDKPYTYKYCTGSYKGSISVSTHVQTIVKSPKRSMFYECQFCPEKFPTFTKIDAHEREHTKEYDGLVCPHCQKGFTTLCRLEAHIAHHTKGHKCGLCKLGFRSVSAMQSHMRNHIKERPHKCPVCQKEFDSSSGLTSHTRRVHLAYKDRPFPCKLCSKAFVWSHDLGRHMKDYHESKMEHKCVVCRKRFTTKLGLKVHFVIHTGERPYSCKMCEKSFRMPGTLNNHMLTHTKEKPHKCPECPKHFRSLCQITTHLRVHTGVKPFKCEFCERTFSQKPNMNVHLLLHTKEFPYVCRFCGKKFVQKGNMDSHVKRMHSST